MRIFEPFFIRQKAWIKETVLGFLYPIFLYWMIGGKMAAESSTPGEGTNHIVKLPLEHEAE